MAREEALIVSEVPHWLQVLAASGDAVGGLATAAAVAYGYMEFKSWKRRAQSTNRASAAASVLAVLDPFCLSVQGWINQLVLAAHQAAGLDDPREARGVLESAFLEGLHAVTAWHRELEAARFSAQAYLTEEELAPAARAITGFLSVEIEYAKLTDRLRERNETRGVYELANTILPPLHAQVSSVRTSGVAALRRIARHEVPVPVSANP